MSKSLNPYLSSYSTCLDWILSEHVAKQLKINGLAQVPQGPSYLIVVMLVVLVFEPSGDYHRTVTMEQYSMLGLGSASLGSCLG